MDAIKLISFLGHSSIYPEFDNFLLENGIKERPKKIEGTQWIRNEELGISLTFQLSDIFDEESLVPQKSEGNFIFSGAEFPAVFKGKLPYELSLSLQKQDVDAKLGSPLRFREKVPSATYFYDGYVIVLNWMKDSPKDRFIRFSLPNIYDKQNLGLSI